VTFAPVGGAIDIWNLDLGGFTRIKHRVGMSPSQGDIVIF